MTGNFLSSCTFLLVAIVVAAGQTTPTLTVNNASGSGDITDFVTGGGTPTIRAEVDPNGNFATGVTGGNGLFLFSNGSGTNDTGISRDSTGSGVFDFGTGAAGNKGGTLNASKFQLFSGANAVALLAPSSLGSSYNFNLPTSAGTSGQPLLSGGGGTTAMTFGTLDLPAGGTHSINGAIATLCAGGPSVTASPAGVFMGFATSNTTEARVNLPVPISGMIKAMHVVSGTVPPINVTITFHARYNNANLASGDLTCAISTTASCDVTVTGSGQSIAEGSGNTWDIEAVSSGVGIPTAQSYAVCLKVIGAN